jgi:hypothetical protein
MNKIYSKFDTSKNRRYIALLLLIWTIFYVIIDNYYNIRDVDEHYLVCDSCDLVVYRTLEMKLEDPKLFVNDRLFALQYPLFPTAFSRGMNILHRFTNNVEISYFIARILLSTVFIVGVFVLTQRISGNYVVTGIVLLLSVFTKRLSLFGDGWGLPLLKPMEVIGAASPWLMWLLYRSIDKSFHMEIFVFITSLLVYVHPPYGLCLLGLGFSLYSVLLYGEKGYLKRIIRAGVVTVVVLSPLFYTKVQTAFDSGPPKYILLNRASFAIFPSQETITNAIFYLIVPMIVAITIYAKVRIHLSKLAQRYMLGLVITGISVTFLSSFSHLWTGLAKFSLHSMTRYLYFPIYVTLALGLVHLNKFRFSKRIIYFLSFIIIGLQMDTSFFKMGKNYLYGVRVKSDVNQYAYTELGSWAKSNTPRDAVFLVPPLMINAGFRVISERAVVVINKDGGNSKYSGTIAREWFMRMQDVKAAYKEGKLSTLEAVARKYSAQYVIVPRRPDSNVSEAVYYNSDWIVWTVDGIRNIS